MTDATSAVGAGPSIRDACTWPILSINLAWTSRQKSSAGIAPSLRPIKRLIDMEAWPKAWEAVKKRDRRTLLSLLENSVDANAQDEYGTTLLCEASRLGYEEIVESLILQGADVKVKDRGGCSPLTYAVLLDHFFVVELLLAAEADIHDNFFGENMLHLSVERLDGDGLRILSAESPGLRTYRGRVYDDERHGSGDYLQTFIDDRHAFGVKEIKSVGQVSSRLAVSKVLFLAGVDINKQNADGDTPLIKACRHGFTKQARFFIQSGADTTKKNQEGKTAMFYAEGRGMTEVVLALRHQ
jgi:ankyrin repeat protein